MNIRFKLLVIVTLTIVLSITLIYYAISSIMLKSYLDIESKYMDSKIGGVTRMITHMCEEFSDKMSDWAMWDDTYSFMADRNAQYIESNINYESMRSLDIDFILFVNGSEEIVLDCFFDHENGKIAASPDSLKNSLMHISRRLLSKTEKIRVARMVSLESKPAIVSSDIILKTGGRGTANGFLIYGRFIDEAEISKFNKMTALNLGFNRIVDGRLDESQKAGAATDDLKYSLHKSLNDDFIICHLIFNDFNDKPLFIVNFKEPRIIYGQAVIALRYFAAALLIAGLIFFVMTSYLIDKFIADRIIKLSSEVKKLSVEGNYQKRLSFNGKDEIASLSSEINGLLDNIEGSNREMKKLVSDLDIATRAKSDFIGSIGHELRTPITCIIGYTDILEDTMPEGESREFVNRIKLSSHILISTVNDILDYTSIEGGDLKLNFNEFKMADVFKEINEYAGFIAAEKKLAFTSSVDDKLLETRVSGDETRLKQVVLNLAGNALKFTNDGFIELGAQLLSDSENEVEIKINIKDSGIGIDEQTQQKIFMPFVQGDSSSTRKYGGAGLGLSIADRLVRLMGGERIKLESKPGEGSNFYFIIKLKKA